MKSLVYVIVGLVSSLPMMESASMLMNVLLTIIAQIQVKGFKDIPTGSDKKEG